MKVFIKQTGNIETLSIIDAKTNTNWVSDFIGNAGATIDGQFTWDDEKDLYVCDKDTYDWWETAINLTEKACNLKYEMEKEHGFDAVYEVLKHGYGGDLIDEANDTINLLNEAFNNNAN
jgi:hypothetical protein